MPRKPNPTSFEAHINAVVARAAATISATVRESIADEIRRAIGGTAIAASAPKSAARKPAAAAKVVTAAPAASVAPAAPAAKKVATKAAKTTKRAWPNCSTKGCKKKFFGPSGNPRLCYEHFIKGGGQHPGKK